MSVLSRVCVPRRGIHGLIIWGGAPERGRSLWRVSVIARRSRLPGRWGDG